MLDYHDFTEVVHSSPAIKSIMIVVGHMATGSKYMFNSNQVSGLSICIAGLTLEGDSGEEVALWLLTSLCTSAKREVEVAL